MKRAGVEQLLVIIKGQYGKAGMPRPTRTTIGWNAIASTQKIKGRRPALIIKKQGDDSMNLDRFSQGIPDPQDAEVMTYCEGCGGEIYPGEDVYCVNGDIIHAEWECLVQYIDPEVKTIEEALGVEA